jgi:hypothetical protein
MADTQEQPQLSGENQEGSIREAQEALLGIMEPEEVKPEEEEATPTEEEESTEEDQDDSLEEVSEEEPEESEEEDEGDLEESAEDQEQEEDPLFTEPLFAVTANGQEIKVTYDELIKGYSRQSDYTQKTQQLSNLRNEYEQAKQQYDQALPELNGLKQQYSNALGQLINNNAAQLERFNIDWGRLKDEDPDKYLLMRDEYTQAQEQVRNLQAKKQYEDAQLAQQRQHQFKQVVQEEHEKMAELLPEWRDPQKRNEISSAIKDYAISVGFNQDELANLVDHRQVISLIKAMSYDALNQPALKEKKIKNKPKVVRSGKGKSSKESSQRAKAVQMKRLQESGHVKDATKLFEDFVDL